MALDTNDKNEAMDKPFPPGDSIQFGDFRILRELGRGGMGIVYEALQVPLNRRVALKVLSGGLGLTAANVARFRREAEAAARLHHTNIVPIYSTGEGRGAHYYSMELIEGPSLKQVIEHLRRETASAANEDRVAVSGDEDLAVELPAWVSETITYGKGNATTGSGAPIGDSSLESGPKYFKSLAKMMSDVADALGHAHSRGVIHRDIKPSNLLLSPDGRLSINDFGLARILDQPGVTVTGEFVGSPLYMSPEQIAAGRVPVDHRTDIYSLGATLYEFLTLQPPFPGQRREQVIAQILQKEPRPPRRVSRRVPVDLETICLKALEKDPDRRYQQAGQMAEDLRRYINGYTITARRPHLALRAARFFRRNKTAVTVSAVVAILVCVAAFAGWSAWEREKRLDAERTAREQEGMVRKVLLPKIRDRIDSGRIVAAFSAALEAKRILPPDDPTLNELWSRVSIQTQVRTRPAGVGLRLSDWGHLEDTWSPQGPAPFENLWIPRGRLRWEFAKDGYATVESARMVTTGQTVKVALDSVADLRKAGIGLGMVRVAGVKARPTDTEVVTEDFFIDKYEVSNEEYYRFVARGGYQDAKWWEDQSYDEEGEKLSWQAAVRRFLDRTGKPGPATWKEGTYPEGEADYPVRGVSWHEAMAYAKFMRKELPTLYHWERAASLNDAAHIVPFSNFSAKGPAPRGRYRGIGYFGVYDMAGNVKEWCFNEMESGRRSVRGGAWDERGYMFGQADAGSPLARPENVGFRCVKYLTKPPEAVLAPTGRAFRDYPHIAPAPRAEVDAFKRLYEPDPAVPLEPITLSSVSAAAWTHETISVNSAHRSDRLVLHLFLPKARKAACQAIVYCPGGGSFQLSKFSDALVSGESTDALALVQYGRAVCWPVYKGTFERRGESEGSKLNFWRELHLDVVRDARRAVDYLQARADIDPHRLSFVGFSFGGAVAPIVVAVEPRFKACVMLAAGLHDLTFPPEVDPLNFAPLVNVPVLMLNGWYDYHFPVEVSQEPLYKALGSKDKKLDRYESGHILPWDQAVPAANDWLDKHLGAAGTGMKRGPH